MSLWEWLGTAVLGLQAAVLVWLVRDYLQFRIALAPQLVSQDRCDRRRNGLRDDLAEIKAHLGQDREQFRRIAVTLTRLCTTLGVPGPG